MRSRLSTSMLRRADVNDVIEIPWPATTLSESGVQTSVSVFLASSLGLPPRALMA